MRDILDLFLGESQAVSFFGKLLDATDTSKVAVQSSSNEWCLKQFWVETELFRQIFMTLKAILLMIAEPRKSFRNDNAKFNQRLNSLFCREEFWSFYDRGDNFLFRTVFLFSCTAFCILIKLLALLSNRVSQLTLRNLLLLFVVIKNYRCILFLYLCRQAVFVVVPEKMKKIFKLDVLRIIVNLYSLCVIANILISWARLSSSTVTDTSSQNTVGSTIKRFSPPKTTHAKGSFFERSVNIMKRSLRFL